MSDMHPAFSDFARGVTTETAFDVLVIAKQLKAEGKKVVELEIGDSPFPSTTNGAQAGIQAIQDDHCHYGPSIGIPEFREAVAKYVNDEYGLDVAANNVTAGPGAKIFETLFCEAFINEGDGVLVFSPFFPTYPPNIDRRGGRIVYSELKQENAFRPNLADIEKFVNEDPNPKAIFINTPHNPTGGIATEEDLKGIADLIRDKDIVVFADEPYDQMAWEGQHHSLLAQPGMLDQCVSCYTFSKSFSMSGWRLGYAVSSERIINMIAKLTNSTLSCIPPFVQMAGAAALNNDRAQRDGYMAEFKDRTISLATKLNELDGVNCLIPGGTFYVFPNVAEICNRHSITSHGLALYLLKGADDSFGVACLGGECFGDAGHGFIRFSTAEPPELIQEALDFLPVAWGNSERIQAFLSENPQYQLESPYPV
ncbi:MAG: aminotransferase class I/II-fold pyridoxal phosphate-dependent enzyme [Pirellulales bacterium]|nr:aminotransferase class I/II-fold pyridoxal phosphate-dependent enzyme [Pirellulales bacterium]